VLIITMFSKRLTVLIQVLTIVLFALVAAAIPQFFFLVFLLYFVISMFLATWSFRKSVKLSESSAGPILYKESAADRIMAYDQLVLVELKNQFKSTMIYLVFPLFALLLIPFYHGFIGPHVESLLRSLSNEFLERFIYFIVLYLFLMGVFQGIRIASFRAWKQPRQLYIPRSFTVYKSGLRVDRGFLVFSSDMCIKESRERKFVEIYSKKLPYIVRLYTLEVSKLYSKLKEAGLHECRESEV